METLVIVILLKDIEYDMITCFHQDAIGGGGIKFVLVDYIAR